MQAHGFRKIPVQKGCGKTGMPDNYPTGPGFSQPYETICSYKVLLPALAVGYYIKNNCHQQHAAFHYILPGIPDTHNGHAHVDDA